MLQQILRDMYIDPEILEELSDDQKQILFFKMREEQIRRWKVQEEKALAEEKLKPPLIKKNGKHVNFYCDGDSNLIIEYITQSDDDDVKKKQESEVMKKAEEQARVEAVRKRKELDELEAKRRRKEEEERLKKEKEEKERQEEARRKAEEESRMELLKETQLQKEKEEAEQRLLEERKRQDEEEKRKREEWKRLDELKLKEELRVREEIENKKRETELAEEEHKRKEEIYERMKKEEEERIKIEEEESKRLDDEWKEREVKAKMADQQRRNSFSYSKNEFERMRKLAKEKEELEKLRRPMNMTDEIPDVETMTIDGGESANEKGAVTTDGPVTTTTTTKSASLPTSSKSRSAPIKRPPLPTRPDSLPRPTISTPVNVTSTHEERSTIPVQKEVVKPSRPPPPPSKGSPLITRSSPEKRDGLKGIKDTKPARPPRPKSKMEVLSWWKKVEYEKCSGLDEHKQPMEWFHGIITRHESEKVLSNKKQGTYLVRVSERVWGYTISFKDIGRCKHFLIDTINGGYQFFGMEQIVHTSLNELIDYHKKFPISGLGQEKLLYPCGQLDKSRPNYEHLFAENATI